MLSAVDTGPFAPCPAPFNMAAHALRRADDLPDKIALAILGPTGSERWSYARLKDTVLSTAQGLLDLGLTKGDRVMLRLGNTVDFPVAYLASIAVGLIPVPTSAQLTSGEVDRMCAVISPSAVIQDPAVAGPTSGTFRIITVDEFRELTGCKLAPFEMCAPGDPAYMVFTSGTSGKPRAVVHAHRAIWARQMMVDGWFGLKESDRLCHAGAFNWTYTLGTGLMDPWAAGATALIPADGLDPTALPFLLKRHDVTIFAAAPGVYRKILKSNTPFTLPKLRHGLSAGEKLPERVRTDWKDATGTEIYEAFGMSECSTFISSSPARPADPATLGRPQPGRKVAIVGSDGPVTKGDVGQIAVARDDPGLMLGYWDAPDETTARYQSDWFLTGDMGQMDEDDQITYLGRDDDMINAGGIRISPIEIEAAMSTCPGLTACAAVAVPVKQDVEVIALFYTGTADETALHTHADAALAGYKRPRVYVHRDMLPTGANGKLLRRVLREGYEAP